MYPRPRRAVSCLKGADFVVAPQCKQDLIKALENTGAAAWIDLEMVLLPCWRNDRLPLKIDADAARALRELNFRS